MKTRAPIDLRVSLYAHSQPITVWVDVLYSVPIKFDDVSAPSITIVNARCRAEQRVWLLCIQAQFSLSIMYSPASRLEVDLILLKKRLSFFFFSPAVNRDLMAQSAAKFYIRQPIWYIFSDVVV
jgi:hypothetical protein